MVLPKDDIAKRNFRITGNNAIDMHVGKRAFAAHTSWHEPRTAWRLAYCYLSASAEIRPWRKPDQRITAVGYQSHS